MRHCDPDVLALRALGEPAGSAEDDAHLRSCTACRAELAALTRTVAAGRAAGPEDRLLAPPERVWHGIAADLGLRDPAPAAQPATPAGSPPLRRRIAPLLLAAAAAVGAVAGIGGTLLLVQRATAPQPATVVARAVLQPLPSWRATGTAEVRGEDGRRVLQVELTATAPAGGYREVWLLDAAAQRLVSLGVLDGDTGQFAVPAGLDLADYPVVDVSLEPFDGDPAHSGDSIVRGTLDA